MKNTKKQLSPVAVLLFLLEKIGFFLHWAKPRIKYLLYLIPLFFLFCSLFLFFRIQVNHSYVNNLKKETIDFSAEKLLLHFNMPDGYIPLYNLGNGYYKNQDYDTAISCYEQALKKKIPARKECSVRVNLALAILHRTDFDQLDDAQKRQEAIQILYHARSILTEHGCAEQSADSFQGHSPEAESLKRNIDEMLRKLEQNPENNPNSQNNTSSQSSKDKQHSNAGAGAGGRGDQSLKRKLEKEKQNAQKERSEDQRMYQSVRNDSESSSSSGTEDSNVTGDSEDSGEETPPKKTW